MCVRRKDMQEVHMFTFHGEDCELGKKGIKTGPEIMISACIKDYINHMGAVDKNDKICCLVL